MTQNTMQQPKRPRCDAFACRRPVTWYVDKTNQDLCDEHGEQWSEDEKIPIRVQGVEE